MKRLLVTGVAVVALVLAVGPAQAHGLRRACSPPPVPVCVTWVEKEVEAYKPVWKEKEVEVEVCTPVYKPMTQKYKCTVWEAKYVDEKRTCVFWKYEPKEVERMVPRCRTVQVKCTDPCTGCTYLTCRPETYWEKVKFMTTVCVPDTKEVMVKVCKYEPKEKEFEYHYTACEWKKDKVKKKVWYCEYEKYKTKVCVPVYTPVVYCP
jgi:hypothetical protein